MQDAWGTYTGPMPHWEVPGVHVPSAAPEVRIACTHQQAYSYLYTHRQDMALRPRPYLAMSTSDLHQPYVPPVHVRALTDNPAEEMEDIPHAPKRLRLHALTDEPAEELEDIPHGPHEVPLTFPVRRYQQNPPHGPLIEEVHQS